jgi:hypothetical protein
MNFYLAENENDLLDTTGVIVSLIFRIDATTSYVVCEGEGRPEWTEVTQEQYEAAGGIIPVVEPDEITLLGQEITDLDLANIDLGQQNTDLELRILELEAKVNV